jgi:hypothetical protein
MSTVMRVLKRESGVERRVALRFLYRRRRMRQPWRLAARASHAMPSRMADQRALDAISRIERALARIESAAARPAPVAPNMDNDEFERLRAAHDTLRRTVAGAIGQIDHLLDAGGH